MPSKPLPFRVVFPVLCEAAFFLGLLIGTAVGADGASAKPVPRSTTPAFDVDAGQPSGGVCSYEPGVSGEYHDGRTPCPTLRSIRVDAQGYVICSRDGGTP